jgi:iron complex outermembrane recepter protein
MRWLTRSVARSCLSASFDANAWALFGQAGYRLSERVSLTGSAIRTSRSRRSSEMERIDWERLRLWAVTDFVDNSDGDAWTPRESIEVRAARDTFVYASATRGFKSGVDITAKEPGGAAPEFV